MKLRDALDELYNCRITSLGKHTHGYAVYFSTATILIRSVAKRLTAQRTFLIGLLAGAVGYGLVLTWVASELVHENQQLTYNLNVSQTAFKIQSESVKRLSHRVDELKTANTALMIELDKKGCIRAINNTPLPKMIKDIK